MTGTGRLAAPGLLACGLALGALAQVPRSPAPEPENEGAAAALAGRLASAGGLSAEAAARSGHELQAALSGERLSGAVGALLSRLRGAAPPAGPRGGSRPERSASGRATPPEGTREPGVPDRTPSFGELWSFLKKEPLAAPYPKETVSLSKFFGGLSFRLLESARRTVSESSDVRPDFPKLIRPNGIGLAGLWRIDQPTAYTGCFSQGSRALVIARASSFSDDTDRGDYRSLGMALKLYATDDPRDAASRKTANVFLIDDNGGARTDHYTDAELTTHPKLSLRAGLIRHGPILAAVALAQRLADKEPGYRQLYPVAELGLSAEEARQARSPERLMLRGAPQTRRVDAKDFREELDVARYPAPGLVFDVFAADGEDEPWRRIGSVRFAESVVSRAVDRNLHFPHPPFRGYPR